MTKPLSPLAVLPVHLNPRCVRAFRPSYECSCLSLHTSRGFGLLTRPNAELKGAL